MHWKTEYGTVAEALKRTDGIAVIGVFFTISSTDNADLAPVIGQLDSITAEGNTCKYIKT